MSESNPRSPLGLARTLLEHGDLGPPAVRIRASALLARQSVEQSVRSFWARRCPGLTRCSARAQLLCLVGYQETAFLAAKATALWGNLSRACHHHPFELAPSAIDLGAYLVECERLEQKLAAAFPVAEAEASQRTL